MYPVDRENSYTLSVRVNKFWTSQTTGPNYMTRTQTMHLFLSEKSHQNPTIDLWPFWSLLIPFPPPKKWQFMGILTISLKDFSASVSGISDFFSANLSRRDGWTAKIHKWHSAWRQDASNTAEYCYFCWGEGSKTLTWMSQEVSKWLVNGLYNLYL